MLTSITALACAILLFISSIYQTYMLSKVHTLVNSNFTEAKQARLAAEQALKTSQDLVATLQHTITLSTIKQGTP